MEIEIIIEIITLLGVLVAIIGVPWYLRGLFAKSEVRVGRVEQKLNELIRSSNTLNNLSGTLIHLLHDKKIMDDDDFKNILGSYTKALDVQEISPNPLSPEELDRLNYYIRKAKNGDFFSAEEVEDYNALVSQLNKERGDDPNVWPLVALGAFLLGLFLASQSKK